MESAVIGMRVRLMRESVGLTQKQLADKLGMQRTALVQVESGARRLSASELVAAARLFNLTVEQFLDPSQVPEIRLCEVEEPVLRDEIRMSIPSQNVVKFKEVLLFILEKIGAKPHVGETVIYKLLYFADFDYYEKFEEQLTGAKYIRNHHGPTPASFAKIVKQMVTDGDIDKVKSEYFTYPQTKYLPRRPANLGVLNAQELDTINEVLYRIGGMNASQISEYSHGDVPWKVTEEGAPILYETVFYRLPPYSVRKYKEE
jgi:transcriptional regulator with XRE-family HTH domain